jgi:hypothetical protein
MLYGIRHNAGLSFSIVALAVNLAIGTVATRVQPVGAAQQNAIDVACDANSIRFGDPKGPNPGDPVGDPGPHPYYGAPFVVQGVIYPKGTLNPGCVANASEGSYCGLLPDGSPEFPDRVIGRWYCRGWFVGEGGPGNAGGIFTPTGAFVVTTQIYDLDLARPGAKMLISDGPELIDLNTPFQRAVTGGTGPFKAVFGHTTQTAIGANATGLFNFQFEFDIRPNRDLYSE